MSLYTIIRDAVNKGASSGQKSTQPKNPSIGNNVGGSVKPPTSLLGLGLGMSGLPGGSTIGTMIESGADAAVGSQTKPAQEDPIVPTDPSEDYINQLKEAQRQSRIAALDKQKAGAISVLDTEEANVEPMYYGMRNKAAAQSDVGAMNFAQYMASRGIKGNAGAMPEIYRNAGLQGQLGALDQQEAGNMADIERQRGLIGTNYAFDVAQANADVETQAMQQMIDQYNQNRQYKLQQAQLTGTYGGTPTLQKQQMQTEATGYYNPWASYALNDDVNSQLAPYMGDLAAFINSNPNSPLVPYAQNARFQKIQNDPTLMQKYGSQYQTVAGRSAATQNKSVELDNIAQEIQNSYLPQTLKMEAQRMAQQVKAGSLDYDTALAQLNQIKAQTSRTRYLASGGRSVSGSSAKNADTNSLYSYYENELPNNFQERGKGIDDYAAYLVNPNVAPTIINDIGSANYAKLVTWANAQVKAAQTESW